MQKSSRNYESILNATQSRLIWLRFKKHKIAVLSLILLIILYGVSLFAEFFTPYDIEKRFPGSFGSALMYFVVPQIILFREEHSPRTLVNQVDFVSAPGVSDENIYRPGGPKYLLTNRALFKFNKDLKKFSLLKLNQNQTIEDIKELTGFKFDISKNISDMLDPDTLRLKILRDKIAPMVSEFYPEFTNRIWGI